MRKQLSGEMMELLSLLTDEAIDYCTEEEGVIVYYSTESVFVQWFNERKTFKVYGEGEEFLGETEDPFGVVAYVKEYSGDFDF